MSKLGGPPCYLWWNMFMQRTTCLLSRCMSKVQRRGRFKEIECIVRHWIHFGAPMYPSFVGLCTTLIKITWNKYIFVNNFVDFVKLTHAKLYKLYCEPYAKFEDQTFDNFHFIGTLTSATYPMSWFSDQDGGKDAEYFIFSFVGSKYHFYHFVIGVKKSATCHQGYLPTINQQGKRGMWRGSSESCFKA